MKTKDDTALAADLGLSGPRPEFLRRARAQRDRAHRPKRHVRREPGRINVFGTDDLPEVVDPSAQTSISAARLRKSISKASAPAPACSISPASATTPAGRRARRNRPFGMAQPMRPEWAAKSNWKSPSGGIDRGPVVPVLRAGRRPVGPGVRRGRLGGGNRQPDSAFSP